MLPRLSVGHRSRDASAGSVLTPGRHEFAARLDPVAGDEDATTGVVGLPSKTVELVSEDFPELHDPNITKHATAAMTLPCDFIGVNTSDEHLMASHTFVGVAPSPQPR
jgi:hypothetical protein